MSYLSNYEPELFGSEEDQLANDPAYLEWVERQHQEAVALMEEEQEWLVST